MAKLSSLTPQTVEQELTCPEKYPWHQASAWETVARHTQWPGVGYRRRVAPIKGFKDLAR